MYFSNKANSKKLNWLHFKPLHKWNSLKRLSITYMHSPVPCSNCL